MALCESYPAYVSRNRIKWKHFLQNTKLGYRIYHELDGFGRLVVSVLASGTQVCGFKPRGNRWIFGRKNPQHVPALRHAKDPSNLRKLRVAS